MCNNLENVLDIIINFNLKKNKMIDYINQNYVTKEKINIPDIPLNITNIQVINNSIMHIKDKLQKLKKKINQQSIQQITVLPTNRYLKQYDSLHDVFWGIGLENECYLQSKYKIIKGKDIIKMVGRERYSVDYTVNYDIKHVKNIMSQVYQSDKLYLVSSMLNAHSLDKMDRNGEHKTTYQSEPKTNFKFSGKSVLEEWFDYDSEIKQLINPKTNTETNIFFDGDTIEFITEKFYKTNTDCVIQELINNKKYFIDKFNDFKVNTKLWEDMGEIKYVDMHPGLNIFKSQPNKIVFFNNTTVHIHLTLPTKINNGLIVDKNLFIETHSKAIKILQWFEPFFICTLGSPDILQWVYEKYNGSSENYFSRGSMRAAMSRYIGIGTYDAELMKKGKLLTSPADDLRPKNNTVKWWRDMINEDLLYNLPKNDMGFDFNYGKHYQSGLEFRILDAMPLETLKDVLDVIILICESSYSYERISNIPSCSTSQTWNNLVYKSLVYGYQATINKNEMHDILRVLNISIKFTDDKMTLEDFYYEVLEHLFDIYNKVDTRAIKYMTCNFNKINRWDNFNKKQALAHIKSLESVN